MAAAGAAIAPRAWGRVEAPRFLKKRFEVSASLYAWDLHDEGVERVLDNLQEMAAVNSVYLIGIMHPEKRPFGDATYSHNPVRQTWQAEDARCYWHPDTKRYGRVKPRLSDHAWLNETDWLRVLVDAARQRGLKTGVEFSHALIDRARMEGELADLAQRDIHGNLAPIGYIKWLRPPCPNHPGTIEYAVALASDAVANYQLDYVQSCIMSFDPAPPELGGGCFCEHCQRVAPEFGLDLRKTQRALLADIKDPAALADWTTFRYASVARFYGRLHQATHALKPSVDLRYNLHSRNSPAYGINIPRMRPNLDSIRLSDYTEQEGDPALMPRKRVLLAETKQQVESGFPILNALGVRLKATPELVREGVKIAVEGGAAGITLGHYDGATFPILRAVREELVSQKVVEA